MWIVLQNLSGCCSCDKDNEIIFKTVCTAAHCVHSCTLCTQLNWSNVHTVHTGPTVFTACALPLEILCCVHFGGGVAIKIISRSPDTHWGAPAQLLLSCLGQVCHARQPVNCQLSAVSCQLSTVSCHLLSLLDFDDGT